MIDGDAWLGKDILSNEFFGQFEKVLGGGFDHLDFEADICLPYRVLKPRTVLNQLQEQTVDKYFGVKLNQNLRLNQRRTLSDNLRECVD